MRVAPGVYELTWAPDRRAAWSYGHLIHPFHISPDIRETLAEQELDELPDGSHEVGVIEWIDYRKTAELPIFPPIGPALADPHAPVTNAALDAVTDANYTWV
ncbi:hypothetical protein ACWGAN_25085 [Streptomyces sp. NPDC054945]